MMNRKLSKLVRNPVAFFKDSKLFKNNYSKEKKINEQSEGLFDYVDDQGNNFGKPVVLVFGINVWKRKIVSDFLSEFSVKFVRKNTPWVKIKNEIKNIDVHAFVFWGMMEKRLVSTYAESKSIPIWRLEDGFLRSVGLGSEHVLPLSLALDKQGIYFNSAATSDLEEKISSIHWDESKQNRAQKNLEMILEFGLTKYNNKITEKNEFNINVPLLNSDKYKILVVGQVEDDASILHGSKIKHTNNDLVRIARAEFPDAEIYYRPHPDVAGGFRKEQSSPADVADICHVVTSNESIITWIDLVDHVFTITSLTGFEALMRGKKVTVLGAPFYAGWGLSDDRQTVARRNTKRSLLEVFYASYIDYPKYHIGFLGSNAEVEHAILSLYLERNGVLREAAEKISSSFNSEEINKTSCGLIFKNIKNNFLDKNIDIPIVEKKSFYNNILSINCNNQEFILKEIISAVIDGSCKKSFETILNIAANVEDKSCLNDLSNINPYNHSIDDYKYFAKILIIANDFNSPELIIEEKINSNMKIFDEDFLFKVFEYYRYLYAEQGRFGRKPIIANRLIDYFEIYKKEIKASRRYLYFIQRMIDHAIHYRRNDYLLDFVDLLKKEARIESNINRAAEILLVVTRSLVAASKRPEIETQARLVLAKEVFEEIEALALSSSININGEKSLPKKIKFILAEMFILNHPLDDSNLYLKAALDGLVNQKLIKEEIDSFKSLVSAEFNRKIKGQKYDEAVKWVSLYKNILPKEFFLNICGSGYSYQRKYQQALNIYLNLLRETKKNQYRKNIASIYENLGKYKVALEWYAQAIADAKQRGEKARNETLGLIQAEARANLLYKSSLILSKVTQPKLPKGVVFVASFGCLNSVSMITPVVFELKKRGYAVIQLDEGMLVNEKTNIEWIDKFSGIIPRIIHTDVDLFKGLNNLWEIDWNKKKIISSGINFYQGIFEIMTQKLRAFNFDINDPYVFKWFRYYLVRSDIALSVCLKIEQDILKKGMPVRFINCGSHSAPFSVYRSFSLQKSDLHNVGFVHMGPAYENYYSNLKSKVASTVSLENLTKYPYYRLPFLARPDLFEEWMTQDGLYEKYQEDINKFLNHNRVGKSENDNSTNEYVEKINLAKARGAKIICAYGKILCDMAVPFDGGPGHENIVDWLKHTVEVARNSDNFFILKPHPHELRPEIARDLNEYWLDNIDKDSLPENVLVLPHNGFNNQDLIPYLDLALLWNGTSSLELCAQGVPVVMASYFGKHDYPVDLIYPESRDDYENILNASSWAVPDRAKMERAALLLKYMGTEEVCIPFKYSYRPITNDPVGVPYWHDDEINGFLKNGDKFISKMADKFFN